MGWVFQKFCHYFFSGSCFKWKLILLALCLHKSLICENSGYRVMNKNALSQSDCMTLESAISQEKIDELIWFFACNDSRNIKDGL